MRIILMSLTILSLLSVIVTNQVNATDSRAQELVKQARAALGGEQALNGIQNLTVSGDLRRFGERRERTGEAKISMLLPDKFKRTETMNLIADVDVTLTTVLNGDRFWTDSSSSGGVNARIKSRSVNQDNSPQAERGRGQHMRMEFARQLASLLLASSPAFPVEFHYKGEASSKDGAADVLEVRGPNGFSALLFLNKSTHRPLMMTYKGVIPRTTVNTSTHRAGSEEEAEKLLKDAKAGKVGGAAGPLEQGNWEVYFSDYRAVNGVWFPHRIKKSVNGKPWEELDIKKYKINASLTGRDFEKQ